MPPRAAAKDMALDIDLHAIGHAGLRTAQVGEDPVRLARERPVRRDIEGADMAAPSVVDVKHALVGREMRARWGCAKWQALSARGTDFRVTDIELGRGIVEVSGVGYKGVLAARIRSANETKVQLRPSRSSANVRSRRADVRLGLRR